MNKLEETLQELGISGITTLKIETLLMSPADAEKNERLYKEVNEKYLLPLVKQQDLGECIHITGEMRALSDSSHRMVCREERKKYHNRIKLVCSLPPISKSKDRSSVFYNTTGSKILGWIKQDWKDPNLKWSDYLDIFDLIGDDYVSLYSLPRPEKIHYSVFGDEYVLLQAHHEVGIHKKEVWFLKSRPICDELREEAKSTVKSAENVSFSVFKRFTLSLSSMKALEILFLLSEKEIPRQKLLTKIRADSSELEYFNLGAAGFIDECEGLSKITEQGNEYLKLFS